MLNANFREKIGEKYRRDVLDLHQDSSQSSGTSTSSPLASGKQREMKVVDTNAGREHVMNILNMLVRGQDEQNQHMLEKNQHIAQLVDMMVQLKVVATTFFIAI